MVKNRKKVHAYLPNDMAKWLEEKSKQTGTPVSRLVEKMLEPHYKKEAPSK